MNNMKYTIDFNIISLYMDNKFCFFHLDNSS